MSERSGHPTRPGMTAALYARMDAHWRAGNRTCFLQTPPESIVLFQTGYSVDFGRARAMALGLCLIVFPASGMAAEGSLASPQYESSPGPQPTAPQNAPKSPHRFWDATNSVLFLGVAGGRALDYVSTQQMRSRGVNELLLSNQIVDNKPLFVAIEAAGTAASIAVSYLFHRSGHHKLERWTSIVHISFGVGGAIRNFGLQPSQADSLTH